MPAPTEKVVGVIDVTPMWSEVLDTLLFLYGGTPSQREVAVAELRKMAQLADAQMAHLKAGDAARA